MGKLHLGATLVLSALASGAHARCSHDIQERGLAQADALRIAQEEYLSKRQLTLDQQEKIHDPTQECAYYYNPLTSAIVNQYPTNWQIAYIVNGDDEARTAYNQIINDPQFPNLAPKGTPAGDISGVNYNTGADPDCWWTTTRCTTPKHPGIPADVVQCDEPNTWGLTYDDGPNCTHNAFYDFLQGHNFTATMFYIGSNVMNWPLQAMRGIADGHEIGVHTWSHRYATALTNEQFFAELWYSRKAIKAVVGVTPTSWRPPYGDIDDRIRFIASKMGLTTVLWAHDSFDWQVQTPGNPNGIPTASVVANYNSVIGLETSGQLNTHGVIVLTHEINAGTMDIAMQELPQMASTFKHVVPVATCRNISHPYTETSYTYPTFNQWLAGNTKMVNGTTIKNTTTTTTTSMSATTTSGSAGPTTNSRASTTTSSSASSKTTTSGASSNVACLSAMSIAAIAALVAFA